LEFPFTLGYGCLTKYHCIINSYHYCSRGQFTLGVRANVQPKSSIPIGAKVEISPKGFTLGVKAELQKNLFNVTPKLLINAEIYGLVLVPRVDKGYHQICKVNLQPLGPMFQHLLALPW
jgi:hypothetical protein